MKLHNNQKALAGEFAVLSQLALHGYDANMTLGNTKKVDILISNPKTGNMSKMEVKTTTSLPTSPKNIFGKTLLWMQMSDKHENIRDANLFYCFVHIDVKSSQFKFFVVPSKIVADYVKREHKYWMKADLKHRENSMRSFRLGFKGIKYQFPNTLLAEEYENKWSLLK